MMFRKLKIGKKLLIAFLVVALMTSIPGVFGLVLLTSTDADYSDALENYGFPQGQLGLLMSTVNENVSYVMMSMAASEADVIGTATQKLAANDGKLDGYLSAIETTLQSEASKAHFKTLDETLPLLEDSLQRVSEFAKKDQDTQAMALYQSETQGYLTTVNASLSGIMDIKINTGRTLSDSLSKQARWALLWLLLVIGGAWVVSIIIATKTSRSISRPLSSFANRLQLLAHGDLSTPVMRVDSEDETGVLGRAMADLVEKLSMVIHEMTDILGQMSKGNLTVAHNNSYEGDFLPLHTSLVSILEALNDTLSQINHAADQVASGSDQVSSGAQALSQGATEQASSVQELAATINEISHNVKGNAESAVEVNNLITHTASEVGTCNAQMEQMVEAMQRISGSSSEIGKIIKTIEDIAFQTNILALNAAVEAARAGAAGKGFAVVADEVRNLASKSAEAAKNTTSLIAHSLKSVEEGASIADATQKSLLGVVDGASKIALNMEKITESSNEQATSVAQVTLGVDQISAVVQTNSATSEQSAAASEELSSQAQMLKGLVGRFQLRGVTSGSISETLHYEVTDDFGGFNQSSKY